MASSSAMDERQRKTVGQYISTPVQVVFSYRLRPLDIYPTDYDLAMDKEEEIMLRFWVLIHHQRISSQSDMNPAQEMSQTPKNIC